jgi:hypothetical protein
MNDVAAVAARSSQQRAKVERGVGAIEIEKNDKTVSVA